MTQKLRKGLGGLVGTELWQKEIVQYRAGREGFPWRGRPFSPSSLGGLYSPAAQCAMPFGKGRLFGGCLSSEPEMVSLGKPMPQALHLELFLGFRDDGYSGRGPRRADTGILLPKPDVVA